MRDRGAEPSGTSDVASPKQTSGRIAEVTELTGLSRATIWLRARDRSFPAPISLGGEHTRAVGSREPDIHDWIDGLGPTV